ncbi:MAG: NAD(P)H-dependent oxidoreductase, partial [Nanoarchaeota archaeon]|nr:NAD(P)H-dependent oxidoreductase [Nanoarchaeota archaeon]
MKFKVAVIYGSVRTGRQGIKAARFMIKKLEERGHEAILIDPLEYKLPFIDKMYKEYEPGEAPEPIEKIAEILRNSDGIMIVSAEYNHNAPPALLNIIDHFQKEYFFKPSAIVTYSGGSFGGIRVIPQLREIMGELGGPAIPSAFPISNIETSIDDKG